MKKAAIIGHFGFGLNCLDGQTVKTKIITDQLCKIYGGNEIIKYDTHGSLKSLLKAPFVCLSAMHKSKNVIILPAHNGLRIYAPLLTFIKKFRKTKLHYAVIGGWMPKMLGDKPRLEKCLKKFDAIYVETTVMEKALKHKDFKNVAVMPNCKDLTILKENELVYATEQPYKLCTFSRVMKEKGIEDAVNAVKRVNEKFGRTVFTLDIYGNVDAGQKEWFEQLQNTFPEYVKYCGAVQFDKSVEVLKNYFALLFPTHYYTEGVPGTIIDAYAAGIPVVSAKWESFSDVVDDKKTGIGFEFDNVENFNNIIFDIAKNPKILLDMKLGCIDKAKMYLPTAVIKVLTQQLD